MNLRQTIESDLSSLIIKKGGAALEIPAPIPGKEGRVGEDFQKKAEAILRDFIPTVRLLVKMIFLKQGKNPPNQYVQFEIIVGYFREYWPQITKILNWVWLISGLIPNRTKLRRAIELIQWAGDVIYGGAANG